jgi:hypothetical protein
MELVYVFRMSELNEVLPSLFEPFYL